MATAIIGIGVVALLSSLASGTRTNDAGKTLTQAAFLAQEIREWTLRLPFKDPDPGDAGNPPGPDSTDPQTFVDDLDDLYAPAGLTFSPPHDGQGRDIPNMTAWSETLSLTWRSPTDIAAVVSPGTSDLIYVQVTVQYNGRDVLTTGWLVSKR